VTSELILQHGEREQRDLPGLLEKKPMMVYRLTERSILCVLFSSSSFLVLSFCLCFSSFLCLSVSLCNVFFVVFFCSWVFSPPSRLCSSHLCVVLWFPLSLCFRFSPPFVFCSSLSFAPLVLFCLVRFSGFIFFSFSALLCSFPLFSPPPYCSFYGFL